MSLRVRRLVLIFFLYTIGLSSASAAQIQKQFVTLAEVKNWAANSEAAEKSQFGAFLLGIHDAFNELFFCTPHSVTRSDIEQTVRLYLKSDADLERLSGADAVRQAMAETYKCGKR
ncbi:Rap1a/Tai family immunity protein [Burkholderiales bacterium]|nr:Rap1a/Tai family immunity protein [Burkholderiales bacterium]